MTVSEYVTRFTQLSCYAPNDVDTDEKKQEYFLNGLEDGLAYALEARDFKNFQTMVDKALVLENRRGILSSKRKQECQTQPNTNSRPHINVNSSPARPIIHPIPWSSQLMPRSAGQGFVTPQQQMIPRPNIFQTRNTRNQSAQGIPTAPNATLNKANTTCFNYGQKGHYANHCPTRRKSSTPTLATPALPSRNGDSTPTQAQQNYDQWRVNQVTMEEAQNALIMEPGTSLVKSIMSYSFFAIFSFLFLRISVRDSCLGGVVLSHPKISNFGL
jgi:hypothetical protein